MSIRHHIKLQQRIHHYITCEHVSTADIGVIAGALLNDSTIYHDRMLLWYELRDVIDTQVCSSVMDVIFNSFN